MRSQVQAVPPAIGEGNSPTPPIMHTNQTKAVKFIPAPQIWWLVWAREQRLYWFWGVAICLVTSMEKDGNISWKKAVLERGAGDGGRGWHKRRPWNHKQKHLRVGIMRHWGWSRKKKKGVKGQKGGNTYLGRHHSFPEKINIKILSRRVGGWRSWCWW